MIRALSKSELPIQVALNRDAPLHRQIYDWFRRAIIEGRLKPGQRVSSTRILAGELGISRNPVLAAYDQLLAEGYFESFTGAGTCVARSIPEDSPQPVVPVSCEPQTRPATTAHKACKLSRRIAAVPETTDAWLQIMEPIRAGRQALDQFPYRIWSKLVNRHIRRSTQEALYYDDRMGYLPLREALAEYLGVFRGVRCDASQVLITTGPQQGLQFCAQVLLDPGQPIWMEDPGCPGGRQALTAVGLRLVPVPVDEEGLDVARGMRIARDARAAFITPSHQMPLGVTMSAARRMQLLDWAVRQGAWILEDDYDSEYRFSGRPITSLMGLDSNARVVYVGAFGKSMFPALQLGYLVVPKGLIRAFAIARDAAASYSSMLYQLVMTDFIREGHFARHVRRTRTIYMEQRSTLVEAIRSFMPDKLEVVGDAVGTQLTVLLPPGTDDVAVSQKAAKSGLSVQPLSACYIKPPARGGLILGYSGARIDEIPAAVQGLQHCI